MTLAQASRWTRPATATSPAFSKVVATFGAGEDNETSLTSAGFGDIFVAKYDPDGALLWATRAGGGGNSTGLGIDVDAEGNIHVTGWFRETAVFGEGEDNETTLTSAGGAPTDIFVAKYDPDGALLWAVRAGGTSVDRGSGIALGGAGNSHMTGLFRETAVFGAGEDNETTLTSAGGAPTDIFVAKYGAGADLDGDGVPDVEDFCPDTQLPEAVPTSGQLLAGRFAIIDQGPEFSTGRARPDADTFTIFDTAGCSCEQIIDLMGLGAGHSRFGCSLGAMRTFIKELPE